MATITSAPRSTVPVADEPAKPAGLWHRLTGWYRRYKAQDAALFAAGLCTMCGEEAVLEGEEFCLGCHGSQRAAP